ncbi:MAG TPA: VWA domain-containing protein [Gammaproteobacteria bacterium]|nr:VWA domain-containing protein [Gammaproteobacteria bacterium]
MNPGTTELQPERQLIAQLTGFSRFARARNFNVGIQESVDSQRLAASIDVTNRRQLRMGLKALMCSSVSDWERFDRVFDAYWQHDQPRRNTQASIGGKAPRQSALAESNQHGDDALFDIPDANALDAQGASDGNLSQGGASETESISTRNFDQLSNAAELRSMEELTERLARRIRQRLLRRQRIDRRGERVDMRGTARASLRYGGLPMSLSFRQRRRQTPKLVLLLDVSRSMSVYSYLFLRFARGILGAFKGADAFAFHTRLVHIGATMREPGRRKLREKMALISAGWDGGTRIDKSLEAFNRHYARNILGSRSIVIIVSDGYDTGEPEELCKQLQRIKRRSRRLIWLNPLLGNENYRPSTRCMMAALPLIDIFASAHNLESLGALEQHLAGI